MSIESTERFIEEQNGWIRRERPCQRDALSLSSGELVDRAGFETVEPNEVQQIANRLVEATSIALVTHAKTIRHVFEHVEMRE